MPIDLWKLFLLHRRGSQTATPSDFATCERRDTKLTENCCTRAFQGGYVLALLNYHSAHFDDPDLTVIDFLLEVMAANPVLHQIHDQLHNSRMTRLRPKRRRSNRK
jgi:hypothetical protein